LSAVDGKIKQHIFIQFSVKLSKSAAKIPEMLCGTFGEHSLSLTAVFEWHSSSKAGRVSDEDDEHSRSPSTSKTTENFGKIQELTHEHQC
jgi:hypothetical protein